MNGICDSLGDQSCFEQVFISKQIIIYIKYNIKYIHFDTKGLYIFTSHLYSKYLF